MTNFKIINDPVHGFMSFPGGPLLEIISHPYYQRLRRIKQLGLTHLVYPGALHTRFHHSLGAAHLAKEAITVLKSKDVPITTDEEHATIAAVLLHDIGHGPFSHALEHSLTDSVNHEEISHLFFNYFQNYYPDLLDEALAIFTDTHDKKFLHQLVSSQVDVDRLDYLSRDSFFTGVSEGVIGLNRIIKMMQVQDNTLVFEGKAIYSLEKFLISRRLMYWQVYLHKTVLAAEIMLTLILKRAKELIRNDQETAVNRNLHELLMEDLRLETIKNDEEKLAAFASLDDCDVTAQIKIWSESNDKVLRYLCRMLVNRNLFKLRIKNEEFKSDQFDRIKETIQKKWQLNGSEADYFIRSSKVQNEAYQHNPDQRIKLLSSGKLTDIAEASDQYHIEALSKTVEKYYVCYPREFEKEFNDLFV